MIEGALMGILIVLGIIGVTLFACILFTPKDQWPWKSPWEMNSRFSAKPPADARRDP